MRCRNRPSLREDTDRMSPMARARPPAARPLLSGQCAIDRIGPGRARSPMAAPSIPLPAGSGGQAWTPDLRRWGKPHYLAIVEALADDIGTGRLPMAARLPPQRVL